MDTNTAATDAAIIADRPHFDLTDAAPAAAAQTGCGSTEHKCSCGAEDSIDYPEFDVRTVPHAIRHATVFGAADAIAAGSGLVIVAPHDPLPLLGQLEARHPGRFTITYLDRTPEAVRVQLTR
ncbi:DUF2249 domain-containing protein [Cryobacterium melibiosiphilum]|uniref:DUF2249 domain-containing protein n=1 Tax=Cryobacterium melibiosiphilum TaxID=995039 RepID=A0A3A5MNE5_9MICO|nr:DUF2249 domain-containing protein [Cryobacterium melibiosiphilum]RJT89349.1 DUF2249 domain-containing protein [Cryobacterium melibiosiphilum]